ncbi:MAG: hypothetical protein KDK78_12280 [Chlamydiia bacterium]|nr:hypothetical protein [Chlamydiia bacterium]
MTKINGQSDCIVRPLELSQKDSTMWECVSSETDDLGSIYRYRFKKEEFPDLQSRFHQLHDIFPAVEPLPTPKEVVLPNAYHPKQESVPIALWSLGFSWFVDEESNQAYITLPGASSIERVWRSLDWNVGSPPRIYESDGVLTPVDFIAKLAEYDVVISKTAEFVHDQYFHCAPAISRIVGAGKDAADLQSSFRGRIGQLSLALKWLNRDITEVIKDLRGSKVAPVKQEPEKHEMWQNYVQMANRWIGIAVDASTSKLDFQSAIKRLSDRELKNQLDELGVDPLLTADWVRDFAALPTVDDKQTLILLFTAALAKSSPSSNAGSSATANCASPLATHGPVSE